ncbi:hypothetical protein [Sphingosinicella sp. BN140058]|uniref:hypothetical protein n=1 Tax=Sphingosinicella sp. BN140058 TaxID=1892855 RepID=UPI001010CCA0|nr:hypothetical protein [Sphingosinicella sp. BN140058]QAY80427.1 hypothetical protein ETR14_27695 [Sphingosinicella sp. BN140058]
MHASAGTITVPNGVSVPARWTEALREAVLEHASARPDEIFQYGTDIWFVAGRVEEHVDTHIIPDRSHHSVGVVILADGHPILHTQDTSAALDVGTFFKIDPHSPHEVDGLAGQGFAFLAWDFPLQDIDVQDLCRDIEKSLTETEPHHFEG